jgi:hypothetical protein
MVQWDAVASREDAKSAVREAFDARGCRSVGALEIAPTGIARNLRGGGQTMRAQKIAPLHAAAFSFLSSHFSVLCS